ncbi:sugar phosphate isomerase/epimerase [uncultured Bacteroides sp.]|uniref:sugar phosphate isomerase/epimerase family protein n=1 Tax=uncultured Bacteroides sp. TaxID=162156 RepID=UPI00262B1137|nr:sugar phosphate isomerase/epimerase family protein [uncultured Bacteroides sp.]
MELSISNIAWSTENDVEMYSFLQESCFSGLEIAPTRIYPEAPYDKLSEAKEWAASLKKNYGLVIPSMQSIWYGHTEKIFGDKKDRQKLIDYTKRAVDFAEAIGCSNLVFGNPKNRDAEDVTAIMPIAVDFFKEIGDYAAEHNTVIALEPNPTIYNTRFMNYTDQAVEMAYKASSAGIKVNVDLGTIIYNDEDINYLKQIPEFINHVHISEPGLNLIIKRKIHSQLFAVLHDIGYKRFVSIEMGNKNDVEQPKEIIHYIGELQ